MSKPDTIQQARDFAIAAHGEQLYGDKPYVVHLDEVVSILQAHGYANAVSIEAAYLHDVIEDAVQEDGYPSWEERIATTFGRWVADAVLFCTSEPGVNRKERQQKNNTKYRKTIDAAIEEMSRWQEKSNPPGWVLVQWGMMRVGVRVKVADRLANVRHSKRVAEAGAQDPSQRRRSLFGMYCKEAQAFRDALYVPGVCDSMWSAYDLLVAEDHTPQHVQAEPVAPPTRAFSDVQDVVDPEFVAALNSLLPPQANTPTDQEDPEDHEGDSLEDTEGWLPGACALPLDTPLSEVRNYIDQHYKQGVGCPACDRLVKEYRRRINGMMAGWLIWLWRAYTREGRWYKASEAPSKFWKNREHARLLHWGLIEQAPNNDPMRRVSGLYRPTTRGAKFVMDEISVPEYVVLHRNKPVGWAEKQVSIQGALGKHFDYIELMAAC